MDFELLPAQDQGTAGAGCCASWTSTSTRRGRLPRRIAANTAAGKRWTPLQVIEELKPKARRRAVEPVPAAGQSKRVRHDGRADQPRVRAAVRNHGPRALVAAKCSTARRPTPATWKPSSATAHRGHKKQWLEPLLDGQDPLGLRDDRARRGVVGRHQHRGTHRARRRRLRHQRPQVVDLRRRRSALQDLHLHGQDRPRRARATRSSR